MITLMFVYRPSQYSYIHTLATCTDQSLTCEAKHPVDQIETGLTCKDMCHESRLVVVSCHTALPMQRNASDHGTVFYEIFRCRGKPLPSRSGDVGSISMFEGKHNFAH